MTWKPTKLNLTYEKDKLTFNRLLLAKRLYLHALEHSQYFADVDKMIAIHNFHNAIEIVLKAIILQYDIRTSKQLNIDFETMMNDIDKYFKDKQVKLPYRQDLRTLNQTRNLVQHHTHEPESSTMEIWKVFTQRFLETSYHSYFGLSFDDISQIEMIGDPDLRELFRLARVSIKDRRLKDSLALSKLGLDWVIETLNIDALQAIDYELDGWIYGFLDLDEDQEIVVRRAAARLKNVERTVALLARGINPLDYKRFEMVTPGWFYRKDGLPPIDWGKKEQPKIEVARWVHNYAVATVVKLQTSGDFAKLHNVFQEIFQNHIKPSGGIFEHK